MIRNIVRRVFRRRKLTPVDEDDTGITPLDIKRISVIRNLVDKIKKLDSKIFVVILYS